MTGTQTTPSRKLSLKDMPVTVSAPHGGHGVKPYDASNPVVVGQTVGYQSVSFRYFDGGGPSQLSPGRPVTMTSPLTHPTGAHNAIVMMSGVGFAYVDGNDYISDHHLGTIQAHLFFQDWNTVAASFFMRDDSITEGVDCSVNGLVLYFT